MISSYEYETEVVTFRKKHKLQMYDNKAISEKRAEYYATRYPVIYIKNWYCLKTDKHGTLHR